MKKRYKKNTKNNFLISSLLIIFSSFFIISPSSAQITSNKCELSGNLFYNNCTKYFGDCQDNKANGWGELYLNNNNTLRGLFVNNKVQNFYIEYYSAANNKLTIGPNRESALHGPCISISNEYVSLANYENGQYRGNGDLFQIPPPNYNYNGIFCDADGYSVKDNSQSNLIPNTSLVIYTSAREYNTRGDRKYWVSVVDLSSNKLIKKFGSYEKPLTINNAPLFIGFTKENKPIYNYSGKYFQFEIMSGIVKPLSKLPLEMISKNNQIETIKKTSYKDLGSISGWGLDKYKILKDSSYVKIFNSKIYLESVKNFKSERGSGSSLVRFNNKNEIINSLELPDYNIIDFDIDEQNERIALSYGGKDSICLSYYDLKTFKLISNVFTRNGGYPGEVKFSKSGTYLLYKLNRGTAIYLGNKLYYGIEGDLYDLNNDENVVISNSGNNVFAYDIEKKTIIWTHPIGDDYINTKFFNVENKIYIISGRALSWEGYKVKENGIKLISFIMPKPLFSIQEFVKKPEETFVKVNITKDKKIDNNNLTEKSKSQIKKADDDLFSNYLALMLLSAIFESSNKYSGGSYSSSNSGSSSGNAQSKIYNTKYGSKNDLLGHYEGGKIYNTKYGSKNELIGHYEGGKIYNTKYGSKNELIGHYEGGKIYNTKYGSKNELIGHYEGGKLHTTKYGSKNELIGHYDGPDSGAAAAAYFLLY